MGRMLAISWLSPFPRFYPALDPSHGMVPPTCRGFPPLLIFRVTALTDALGCFQGDSEPRKADNAQES